MASVLVSLGDDLLRGVALDDSAGSLNAGGTGLGSGP
jgi:hypothetical protein